MRSDLIKKIAGAGYLHAWTLKGNLLLFLPLHYVALTHRDLYY